MQGADAPVELLAYLGRMDLEGKVERWSRPVVTIEPCAANVAVGNEGGLTYIRTLMCGRSARYEITGGLVEREPRGQLFCLRSITLFSLLYQQDSFTIVSPHFPRF